MSAAEAPTDVPVADLPSGAPIPSSIPPPTADSSSSSPPSSNNSSKAAPRLPLSFLLSAPSRLDAFIAHLNRCMQTPSGADAVLQFVCYTSRLSSALLASLAGHVLARRSASELVALALALPSRATAILFTTAAAAAASPAVVVVPTGGVRAGAETAAARAALLLSARLKALSGLCSEARTITRLWALLGLYFWARSLVLETAASLSSTSSSSGDEKQGTAAAAAHPRKSLGEHLVAWAQLLGCLGFQVLENGAYLSSRGVLGWGPEAQARAGVWSVRAWGVFVGLEIGRLAAQLSSPDGRARLAAAGELDASRKTLARNLAWAPLVVHWGGGGYLPDAAVGLLGCVPGTIGMRDLWKKTAA
ncbi:uncharacterized protein E0L32_009334 [Thyridium curvatum]|uniref:Peroxin 11C n=1 Tax=Thyridium curvatum TaxID=1093900 RepID=A0A507ARX0_9PEZI|nr:uncharacterized protein E0L32_009334 [Thyridium curvatum]TPX09446.1 hypothetical protein E0L32_009334 [Thyridium curvatum]